jgi:hypothetical protein
MDGINQIKEYKYLGIIFDKKLDLSQHIKYIKNKTLIISKRIQKFCSRLTLETKI